jgi:hypothetical protein
MAVLVRQG